jgi:hypothetical protein
MADRKLRVRVRPAGKDEQAERQDGEGEGDEEAGEIGERFCTLKPIGKGAPCKGLPYLSTLHAARCQCRVYGAGPGSSFPGQPLWNQVVLSLRGVHSEGV